MIKIFRISLNTKLWLKTGLFLLALLSTIHSFSQTYVLSNHNFNTSNGWNLGKKTNKWVVNSTYTCAGSFTAATPDNGNGGYLHIYSETALPLYGGNCACYNPTATSETVYANITENISTIGFDSITINFDWLCKGNANNFGFVQISTNGGTSYTTLSSPLSIYNNQSTWTSAEINSTQVPALLGTSQLIIRFGFTSGATRSTPGFAIDNLSIKGYVKNNTFKLVNRTIIPELCSKSKTGVASMLARGGTRPYTYVWKNNLHQVIPGLNDSVANNLAMGAYTVVAYDNAGNSDSVSFYIFNIFTSPIIYGGANDTICANQTHQLTATGGTYYQWTPQSEIQGSSNIFNPVAHPDTTTHYVVHGESAVGDYISNGDFSLGNVGFYSDYIYFPASTQDMSEGKYSVRPDPGSSNIAWWQCNFADHTPTADGTSMIVNGSNIANVTIWGQTVSVTPNTNYAFSTWLSSMHTLNPALLQFSVNGQLLGTPFNASPTICEWLQFYQIWNSGSNTSVSISIVNMNTIGSGNDFALDDISFAPLCGDFDTVIVAISQPIAFAGNDTSFCGSSPTLLTATGGTSYSWNTNPVQNTQQISVSPTTSTTYTVTATDKFGCTNSDQVMVNIGIIPLLSLGVDTTLCTGNSLFSDATNATINHYLWNDGLTTASRFITTAGTYWVRGSNDCGSVTDTIHVYFQDHIPIVLGNDTTICQGNSVVITAPVGYESYLWSNGSTGSSVTISTNSSVGLKVFDSLGCSSSDTMEVTILNPITLWLGNDTLACNADSVHLIANSGFSSYLWNTNATTPGIWVHTSGTYSIVASQNGVCFSKDTIAVTISQSPVISLGNDTTICQGNSVVISAPVGYESYLWSNGSTGSSISVSTNSSVGLKVFDSLGCSSSDTMEVTILNPITLWLGNDTLACNADSVHLIANSGFSSYLWNTNATTPGIWVHTSGTYSIVASQNGVCFSEDTIAVTISQSPSISLGNDTTICNTGNAFTIHAPANTNSWLWSDGSTANSLQVNNSGSYWLRISNSDGCSNSDTVVVTFYYLDPVSLGEDVDFCGLSSFNILASTTEYSSCNYQWSDGSSSTHQITVDKPGLYWVKYGNNLCSVTDTIELFDCPELIVPNVFSPNNDGHNDTFKPKAESIGRFKMTIFNRWGDVIFQTEDYLNGWNGEINKKPAADGVYFWTIEYAEKFFDGNMKVKQGSVTLLR